MKIEVKQISPNNSTKDEIRWNNSANILCNYMKELKFLKIAIKQLALMPRYFEERIDYYKIQDWTSIAFPMDCFCDIPLSKVALHMDNYGHYGIALKKNNVICRDVQPIHYINVNSRLCEDFSSALEMLYTSPKRIESNWEIIPDALLSHLLYTKPIKGFMRRINEEPKERLFQDECEWRYIPKALGDLPLILPSEYNNDKGIDTYSKVLSKNIDSWFKYQIEDIEYIIVPDEKEAMKLIRFIRRMKGDKKIHFWNSLEKDILISKITIADKFNKNLT